MTMNARVGGMVVACVAAGAMMAGAGAQPVGTPALRVALTFDDLPVHGPLPPGMSRVQVARTIVETLTRYRVPAPFGFVNGNGLDEDPANADVLRLWREAGFPLGNHAYSHMDLHANPLESFERDITLNEAALQSFMGDADWRWFRFPFLREGDTPEKYAAVRQFLARRNYRVAHVTMNFDDYAYNDPYARCAAVNDRDGLAWLERSYLDRAAESLVRDRETARRIFGRDIRHVMLLHLGAFQTVMLPRLLDLLREKQVALVTLPEAQADAAYAAPPRRGFPRAGTFLEQVDPEPRKASSAASVFAQLRALCVSDAR